MKSNKEIFTEIYENNFWGGLRGEFYSGSGSHNQFIEGYVNVIKNLIIKLNIRDIIEIGCGDYYVTGKIFQMLKNENYDRFNYTGIDVVEPLIESNKKLYSTNNVNFLFKDACEDKIPSGEMLIIRQVLQHLDNKSILKIIEKFNNYKFILLTEHQLSERYFRFITPNEDKTTNYDNRLNNYSGVYVEKSPFNYKSGRLLFSILEQQGGMEAFINTFLITNECIERL